MEEGVEIIEEYILKIFVKLQTNIVGDLILLLLIARLVCHKLYF